MNKHLLLTIVVFLISILAKAQTNVSGNITGNTTWTKAGSPYILTGNVGVRAGYTLTIEPGVTVKRNGDYQILINGALQINGTTEDSIQFVNGMNVATNSKYFIEFQKSELNNSSLSYISFQHNSTIDRFIRLGNESYVYETNPKNSGTLYITHSNLSNGYITTSGYQTQAHLSIDSCIMNNGLVSSGYRSEDINLSNSRIVNSTVSCESDTDEISFTKCYLGNNRLNLTANANILNCIFENNQGWSLSNGGVIIIKSSNFINTNFDNPNTNFDISDSKFTVNDKITDPYGSVIPNLLRGNHISVRNSRFINNSSYNVNCINITGSWNPVDQHIIHNHFTNFYDVITVDNLETIQLDSNYFSIPGRYDIVNNSVKDFAAFYNYYQLKNGQIIDDVIFDQNDDLAYGLVNYTPYIANPVVLPVTALHFNGMAAEQSVKLSWQANKETNLSEYVIERKAGNSFISIGFVAAGGNASGGVSNYSFTDSLPVSGTNYYRLKIVDADGRYTYSGIVPVTFSGTNKRIAIYPNPAISYVIVEHAIVNAPARLMLVDMQGRKIKTIVVAKGSTQTRVDVHGIAKGIYKIVRQVEGKTTEGQTLLIQ